MVDHITPFRGDWALFIDPANHESLCETCHNRKTAKEMAKNGAFITGSDACVSVTGTAGPTGGTEEKPVGLVYIGCCYNNKTVVKEFHFKGERQKIREQATANALILLRECILADKGQE